MEDIEYKEWSIKRDAENKQKLHDLLFNYDNQVIDCWTVADDFLDNYRFACMDDDFDSAKAKRIFHFTDEALATMHLHNQFWDEERREYARKNEVLQKENEHLWKQIKEVNRQLAINAALLQNCRKYFPKQKCLKP